MQSVQENLQRINDAVFAIYITSFTSTAGEIPTAQQVDEPSKSACISFK
jgi:hypothetical protein